MADDDTPKTSGGVRFNGEITLGTVLVIASMVCGAIVYIVNSNAHSDQTGHDLTTVQATVGAQITDLRTTLQSGLNDVKAEIKTLPDQRARLDQVERRMNDTDQWRNRADGSLNDLDHREVNVESAVNGLMRAANAPLIVPPPLRRN